MEGSARRTPLYGCHKQLGAKFTVFAGLEMPVLYSGVIEEHRNVRERAGIFDVSHMGQVFVEGPGGVELLQYAASNDLTRLPNGKAHYSLLLNENGGVVDDLIVYKLAEERFLVCVNASNREKDVRYLHQQNRFDAVIRDESDSYSQIALQGPEAQGVFEALLDLEPGDLSRDKFPAFTFREIRLGTLELIAARTGYTGEDGFEIFLKNEGAALVWDAMLEVGSAFGLQPIGLGARDTLRLEAAMPLYGHELSDNISPYAAGLGWAVKLEKKELVCRAALEADQANGTPERLVGLEAISPGIPREGMAVFSGNDKVGCVTSGTKIPTIESPAAMAYVQREFAALGTELEVQVRDRRVKVRVRKLPFYKRG